METTNYNPTDVNEAMERYAEYSAMPIQELTDSELNFIAYIDSLFAEYVHVEA